MRSLAFALVCAACWTDPPPPEPPKPEPARTRALPQAPPCANDPATETDVHRLYNCAVAALDVHDYTVADQLAVDTLTKFPYSRLAISAELMRADILAARRDWAGAYRAYDDWLRAHPSNDARAQVMEKRDAAASHLPVN